MGARKPSNLLREEIKNRAEGAEAVAAGARGHGREGRCVAGPGGGGSGTDSAGSAKKPPGHQRGREEARTPAGQTERERAEPAPEVESEGPESQQNNGRTSTLTPWQDRKTEENSGSMNRAGRSRALRQAQTGVSETLRQCCARLRRK